MKPRGTLTAPRTHSPPPVLALAAAALCAFFVVDAARAQQPRECNTNCPRSQRDANNCCPMAGAARCAAGEHLSAGRCCAANTDWVPARRACVATTTSHATGTVRAVVSVAGGGSAAGAELLVDGVRANGLEAATEPGQHVVDVRVPGCQPERRVVSITAGQVTAVPFDLTPIAGTTVAGVVAPPVTTVVTAPPPPPPPPPPACADFTGVWSRPDGFTMEIRQRGCSVSTQQLRGGPGWRHDGAGTAVGSELWLQMRRLDPDGCINVMRIRLTMEPGGRTFLEDTTGTDGNCNLAASYTEHFRFVRE